MNLSVSFSTGDVTDKFSSFSTGHQAEISHTEVLEEMLGMQEPKAKYDNFFIILTFRTGLVDSTRWGLTLMSDLRV